MGLKAIVVAGFLAVSAAQAADGGRQWIGAASAEGASLIYGTPQSDDVVLRFACDPATKELTAAFGFEPVGAADGMELDLELSSQGGSLVLHATGQRMLMDDSFVLEAKAPFDPALRDIITEGETLFVMAEDGVEEIPLAGAAEQAAAFFQECAG